MRVILHPKTGSKYRISVLLGEVVRYVTRKNGLHLHFTSALTVNLHWSELTVVLWIWTRIRMFLDLPDLDPSLFVRIRILPSTSKKAYENL